MANHWRVGETRVLSTTVTSNGIPTDAAQISFKYKITRRGVEYTLTPTHSSTGVYYVSVTPPYSGLMYCRWDTDGALDVVAEPMYHIAESAFN